ncbi:hypothetical protein KAU34_01895 [candidate division WOR-3 bacterium]|nr:hypothetical protein [candidate division WOR-3 bacterium]MCK4575141.1 hypothetical protein [candidate division WOR-3 bacterium]
MKGIKSILLEEGLDALIKEMGIIKAIKFIQLLSLGKGDSVREIEGKTERMGKEEALSLIKKIGMKNAKIWKEFGLL